MKRKICLLLIVAILATPTIYFAEPQGHAENPGAEVTNNRYTFRTVKGPRTFEGSMYIRPADFNGSIAGIAEILTGHFPFLGTVSGAYKIAQELAWFKDPGTVSIYRTITKTYKVDRLTGQERLYSTHWTIEMTMRGTNGRTINRSFGFNLK